MRNGRKRAGKYRSNGAVLGSELQGGGTGDALVRQKEIGGDGVDAEVTGVIPPPGGTTY